MANEYDYKCEGFELKAVPRSEFEALKRFGDHQELPDGTLMRADGDVEFRLYCEDVEGCPIRIVTQGVLNLFADLYDDVHPREADHASKQSESFPDNVTARQFFLLPGLDGSRVASAMTERRETLKPCVSNAVVVQ